MCHWTTSALTAKRGNIHDLYAIAIVKRGVTVEDTCHIEIFHKEPQNLKIHKKFSPSKVSRYTVSVHIYTYAWTDSSQTRMYTDTDQSYLGTQ